MKQLVTSKEEKFLKKILSLSPVPEITLSYYELRGYIYGIAITPDVVEPGEWMPLIFGDEVPVYASQEQSRQLVSTLLTVLNRHIAAFAEHRLSMPFTLENLDGEQFDKVVEWTSGFEEALTLRPEFWDEYQGQSEDDHDLLMNSLVVVEGIVYPEEAVDMFDHVSRAELLKIGINLSGDNTEKIAQIQYFMLQALELSVETIQGHASRLEQLRKQQLRSSDSPFQLRSSSVVKSSVCPCGSGRKYKDCCSSPFPPAQEVKNDSSGKKSKIITVDFPRLSGKKAPSVSRNERTAAGLYQLQLTLSFTEPAVWRRIQVPCSFTLAQLHKLVQLVMGWQDRHLHLFQAGDRLFGEKTAWESGDVADESQYALVDLERQLYEGILYTYDLGDDWQHVLLLEEHLRKGTRMPVPRVVDGARACPPEDIGGVGLYQEFLAYLGGAPAKHRLFEGISPGGYDPETFDIEGLNRMLEDIYGQG